MEQLFTHQPPGPSRSQDEEERVVHNNRRRSERFANDQPVTGRSSENTQLTSQSKLPFENMNRVRTKKNQENKTGSSPFNPGRNTMGSFTSQTKQVNSSRGPLARGGPNSGSLKQSIGQRATIPIHLHETSHIEFQPVASSTPSGAGPSKQPPHVQRQRRESRGIMDSAGDSDGAEIVYQEHRNSRSISPAKPPTSGQHRRSSIEAEYNSHHRPPTNYDLPGPPRLPLSAKGKERMPEYGGSSPTKCHGNEATLIVDDEIKDPNGVFKDDSDVEVVETHAVELPEPIPPEKRRKSPEKRQLDTINRHLTTNDKPRMTRNRPMRDKNGNVPPEPSVKKQASVKKTMKDRIGPQSTGTIPSSGVGNREASADIKTARFNTGQSIECASLRLAGNRLQLNSYSGLKSEFWEIPLDTVGAAQICSHQDHPFLLLDVATIPLNHRYPFSKYIERFGEHGYQEPHVEGTSTLLVIFIETTASKNFLDTLRHRLDEQIKVDRLDLPACHAMREFIGRPAEPRGRDARKQVESKPRKAADATTHRLEAEEPKARTKAPRKLINDNSDEETPQSRSAKRDRQVDDPNQGKLPFLPAPKPLPRRTRHSGATINYDESEPETSVAIAPAKPKPVSRFKGNRSDLLFPYPTTGRAEVTITVGDAQRIETGEFLNDTLLEFGLRKMLDELNVEIQSTIHLFNSFFYERLADRSKRPEKDQEFWPGYQSVRKWSKGKDIFEKDFIVVPINENFHWYLAVIVNPKGILRPNAEGNSSMPDSNAHRPVTRALAENDAGDASSVEEQLTAPGNRTDEDLNDLDSEAGDAKTQRSQGTPPLFDQPNSATSCQSTDVDMNDVNDISKDPLDCIDDDDNEGIRNGQPEHTAKEAMREVSTGVGNMDINSDQETEPDLVGEGGPIISTTLQAIAQQNSHLQNPTTEKIGTGHSQVRTKHPDAEIVGSEKTWIITFDSLGGPHAAVGKHLNSWLRYEAKDKKGIDYKTSDAVYWEGRVPQQPNFYDCGIYVVHYAKQFLQNPTKILQFVQRRAPYSNAPDREAWIQERAEVWNASDTENMRSTWEGQLQSLAEQYQLFKASQPPDEVSKDNEQPDDMPVENLEQQQGRIVNSQPESILLVPDANGHELPSEEEPNFDPIPGAFPTPVTQQPEPPKAQSPSPPATKPKWSTTPSDDQRGRRRSSTVDIDPKIKTSTKSESLSPAPSDHEILQGTFTSVHDKKAHTSPSFRSIDTGIVQNRRHAFESTQYRTEGPITRQRNAISTSPIRKGRASEEGETAYREVEHLRPRRNPLADLDTEDSPPASSSTLNAGLLPSGLSGSEDPILLPRNNNFHVTSSPFDNLGRFVPGQPSNQQERIEPAHPPKDPLDFDNSEQALDDDQVFVASDISQHLGQKDKSPTSLTSDEEEQEPIENLPAKASPIVKHQYSSKSKSIKRMLSTEKSQSKLPVTKKPKTAISTTKGSTKGKGPNKQGFGRGTTKEEAIDIESD